MTAEASLNRQESPEKDSSGRRPPALPEKPSPLLVPFCFWLPHSSVGIPAGGSADPGSQRPQPPDPAALSVAIGSHLAGLGWSGTEPLRWAITAVDAVQGLQLEGVVICASAAPDSRSAARGSHPATD